MYQGDTENTSFPGIGNTSFPNFDSLDKKTHEYISQPHWDHKISITKTDVSPNTLTFSNT